MSGEEDNNGQGEQNSQEGEEHNSQEGEKHNSQEGDEHANHENQADQNDESIEQQQRTEQCNDGQNKATACTQEKCEDSKCTENSEKCCQIDQVLVFLMYTSERMNNQIIKAAEKVPESVKFRVFMPSNSKFFGAFESNKRTQAETYDSTKFTHFVDNFIEQTKSEKCAIWLCVDVPKDIPKEEYVNKCDLGHLKANYVLSKLYDHQVSQINVCLKHQELSMKLMNSAKSSGEIKGLKLDKKSNSDKKSDDKEAKKDDGNKENGQNNEEKVNCEEKCAEACKNETKQECPAEKCCTKPILLLLDMSTGKDRALIKRSKTFSETSKQVDIKKSPLKKTKSLKDELLRTNAYSTAIYVEYIYDHILGDKSQQDENEKDMCKCDKCIPYCLTVVSNHEETGAKETSSDKCPIVKFTEGVFNGTLPEKKVCEKGAGGKKAKALALNAKKKKNAKNAEKKDKHEEKPAEDSKAANDKKDEKNENCEEDCKEVCTKPNDEWRYLFTNNGWSKMPDSMCDSTECAASFDGINRRLAQENLNVFFSRSFTLQKHDKK